MQVDARFRFDNYVVGSANRLAVAAARAVAESPGAVYNPLFIYSGSGLGKTHLIGAIGNEARRSAQPELERRVRHARGLRRAAARRDRRRRDGARSSSATAASTCCCSTTCSSSPGQRETQSELLRLFNALQGSGRQIVMTSDRPPSEIADVDERLITRLARRADRRHRRARLRDARRDPARQVRGAAACASRRRARGARAARVHERARAAGRAQPARRAPVARRRRSTPAQVRAIARRSPSRRREPAPPPPALRRRVLRASSPTSPIAVAAARRAVEGRASARRSRTGAARAIARRCSSALLSEPTAPPNVEALLRGFGARASSSCAQLEAQVAPRRPVARRRRACSAIPSASPKRRQLVERALAGARAAAGPQAAFARARFEESASNQLAVRAADAVDRRAGQRYNPLFVTGPSGVGKTHLLQRDRQRAARRERRRGRAWRASARSCSSTS